MSDIELAMVDGCAVVLVAKPEIIVYDLLLQQIAGESVTAGLPGAERDLAGRESAGYGVFVDGVLSVGTAGLGLGRVSYRWRSFDPILGVHTLDRIS